jgi:site-specific recombinase XerD
MDEHNQPPDITAFLADLARQPRSEKTWQAYRSDLNLFAQWLTQTTGDAISVKTLTRIDVRDYKQHLLAVEGRAAATVNRRLAALRALCGWAKRTGRVTEPATDGIGDVPVPRQAPKALDERSVDRVLRRSAQSGNRCDHAILMTLRHTGLGVTEFCDLRIGDVVTGELSGTLTVRASEGMKQRTVPLNAGVRRVLAGNLTEERHGADPGEYRLISQRRSTASPTRAPSSAPTGPSPKAPAARLAPLAHRLVAHRPPPRRPLVIRGAVSGAPSRGGVRPCPADDLGAPG